MSDEKAEVTSSEHSNDCELGHPRPLLQYARAV